MPPSGSLAPSIATWKIWNSSRSQETLDGTANVERSSEHPGATDTGRPTVILRTKPMLQHKYRDPTP